MKKLVSIIVAFFLGALHCLAAGNYSLQWQKGDSFYEQKQYDSAAFYFEQIAAVKPRNAEVYYNLGNAYYRLNKIAQAVLNYERALRINPRYKEAADNLMLAQARVSNHIVTTGDIFFIKWWDSATQPDKAAQWAVIALIIFVLIVAAMAFRYLRKAGEKSLPVQLPGFLGIVCLCFFLIAFCAAKNSEQHSGAVVMETDAPLMNNDLKGKPITLLPEGTCVKIISKKDNWAEIRLPDGRTGWVQQNLVEII